MKRNQTSAWMVIAFLGTVGFCGCASTSSNEIAVRDIAVPVAPEMRDEVRTVGFSDQLSNQDGEPVDEPKLAEYLTAAPPQESKTDETSGVVGQASDLSRLIEIATERNPRLQRLYSEYQAAAARSRYVDKLPDPKIGASVFGNPIETASGSQRANLSLAQSIPSLDRLNAQEQQACFEALAIRTQYAAERLRVIAGVRTQWYELYAIDRQIESAEGNKQLLESLVDIANARIATAAASQGDVLLGTLELSKLEERLYSYRKQRRSVQAEINRLLARRAETPIKTPDDLAVLPIPMDSESIHQIALGAQPELQSARLRVQASRWEIEVARLQARPDWTLSANYFVTDDNRPATSVVNVGEDPWAIGVQVSVPVWRQKLAAMRSEAGWKHQAAHDTVKELSDHYESLILGWVAEAERASDTIELYASTILPQARQTLSADQESFATGDVEFDRVVQDYRNLLTLEVGYHQAVSALATANARLRQAAGVELEEIAVGEGPSTETPSNAASPIPDGWLD